MDARQEFDKQYKVLHSGGLEVEAWNGALEAVRPEFEKLESRIEALGKLNEIVIDNLSARDKEIERLQHDVEAWKTVAEHNAISCERYQQERDQAGSVAAERAVLITEAERERDELKLACDQIVSEVESFGPTLSPGAISRVEEAIRKATSIK